MRRREHTRFPFEEGRPIIYQVFQARSDTNAGAAGPKRFPFSTSPPSVYPNLDISWRVKTFLAGIPFERFAQAKSSWLPNGMILSLPLARNDAGRSSQNKTGETRASLGMLAATYKQNELRARLFSSDTTALSIIPVH
jgi:hypothetical protein